MRQRRANDAEKWTRFENLLVSENAHKVFSELTEGSWLLPGVLDFPSCLMFGSDGLVHSPRAVIPGNTNPAARLVILWLEALELEKGRSISWLPVIVERLGGSPDRWLAQ